MVIPTTSRDTKIISFSLHPTEDLTVGNGKVTAFIPPSVNGRNIQYAHVKVDTAPVGSVVTINIFNIRLAANVFSTPLTIDAGETGSETAAIPVVIDLAQDDLLTNDKLRLDVTTIGSSTAGKGLVVTLECGFA